MFVSILISDILDYRMLCVLGYSLVEAGPVLHWDQPLSFL